MAEARGFEHGAVTYDRDNYKKGTSWNRVMDSCLRHIMKFNSGINIDADSGLNHLWLAKCNLAMLIYFYENQVGVDDRFKKP